jgi:hypothetical protein
MYKFMLTAGLVLGVLVGMAGASQAVEDKGLTKQVISQGAFYRVGDAVYAYSNGQWYRATIQALGNKVYLVSFDGFGREYDQWIDEGYLSPR